jgi:hypothetical protein
MQKADGCRAWALEEFGAADLGDERRTSRLVSMAEQTLRKPGGKVSAVFLSAAERQGAYDFLECGSVDAVQIGRSLGEATARRAAALSLVTVAIDGSSLTLANRAGQKDFGRIGSYRGHGEGSSGLKVISSLVMDASGTPLGLVDQRWWVRTNDPTRAVARGARKKERIKRTPVSQKETQRWLDAIVASEQRFEEQAPAVRRCYVLDREADARPTLEALEQTQQAFVVRSSWDRRIESTEGRWKREYLRERMRKRPALGRYSLHIDAGPNRQERQATMAVRSATVTLQLRHAHQRKRVTLLTLHVVWAREIGPTPRGEQPIDWMLLTNLPVETLEQSLRVVRLYSHRWRIEDFHRTWKSGRCNVEAMQLRSTAAATKWATILAAVAARTERLKHLARTRPNEPASVEFTEVEIRALIVLKRDQKKKNETIPDAMPTIADATRWIAELGGYTGKSSGGPPGSTTISRGLDQVLAAARLLHLLRAEAKRDQ